MKKTKQALLIGAGVVTIGAAGMGVTASTYALSGSDKGPDSTLIDTLVSKFNLNKSDVEKVFEQAHDARHEEMKADRETALKSALDDKKISQSQYNHIKDVWSQMDKLHEGKRSDANRKKMHNLMEKLRKWMDAQKIDKSIMGMPPRGGHDGPHNDDNTSS